MASLRRIQLIRFFQETFVAGATSGFRIRVEATNGFQMPDEIFAYRMLPIQPGQAAAVGVFDHVCSAYDLANFPVGAPEVNASPPWFRLASIDVILPSRVVAEATLEDVQAHVTALKLSLDATDKLVSLPSIWIGQPPA